MAEQYNISIVIEGKDKASRPIGGVSNALKDMGKIAGGIIGAQVLTSIARGIANMGREALNAVASFERIGLALQNLAAREFIALNHADRFVKTMREQAGWTDQQANRYAHLRQQYEQLSDVMAKMAEQGRQNTPYYQGLIKRQGQIEKQIKALIPNYDSLSDVMKKAAFGGVKMADALRAAIKPSKELMKWSIQLAIHSPFDTKSVVNAMKTAMAYGFTMREAQKLTSTMIDFAAATGASKDVMNRIALALGQVKAKGRLMGQEILQLVNAGVPVNDILAEMGANLQDVRKKGVGAQEFIAAFTRYMQTNFAGAADRQTQTWAGLINTFGDLKQLGLKALFEGIFGAMEPVVAQFSNWLQDKGLERLKTMGERLGEITRLLVGLATADISSLSGLFYKWKIPQATQERIFGILNALQKLKSGDFAGALRRVGINLAIPQKALAAWETAKILFEKIGSAIAAVLLPAWERVKSAFQNATSAMVQIGGKTANWHKILKGLGEFLGGTFLLLIGVIAGALNGIARAVEFAAPFIAAFVNGVGLVVEGVMDTLAGLVEYVIALFNGDDVSGAVEQMKQGILEILQGLVQGALGLIIGFGAAVLGFVQGFIEGIIGFFVNLYDELVGHSIIPDMLAAIENVFRAVLDRVLGVVVGFAEGVVETISTWLDEALGVVGLSLDDLHKAFEKGFDRVLKFVDDSARGIKKALNIAKDLYGIGANIMHGLWDGLRSVYDSLKKWFEETIGALIDKIKAITGVHSPSKVFAGIGRDWMLGLAQGIQQNAALPAAALAGAAGGATQMVTNQTWNVHVHGGSNMDESDIVRGVMVAAWLAGGA